MHRMAPCMARDTAPTRRRAERAAPQRYVSHAVQQAVTLTARGRQYYTQPEITVEVPAFQLGTGRLGAFRLETYRVYTEAEFPEIGELFRDDDDGSNNEQNPGLASAKAGLLSRRLDLRLTASPRMPSAARAR